MTFFFAQCSRETDELENKGPERQDRNPGIYRAVGVLEIPPGLLVAANLLHALHLQVGRRRGRTAIAGSLLPGNQRAGMLLVQEYWRKNSDLFAFLYFTSIIN